MFSSFVQLLIMRKVWITQLFRSSQVASYSLFAVLLRGLMHICRYGSVCMHAQPQLANRPLLHGPYLKLSQHRTGSTQTHNSTLIHIVTHMYTHTHSHKYVCSHAHSNTHVHIRTFTQVHSYTHIDTNTHTWTQLAHT